MTATSLCETCVFSTRSGAYLAVKRVTDSLLAVLVLAAMIVLGGVIWCLMRLARDNGPLFYTETRLGYLRQAFTIYKFRTMKHGATGTPWTVKNDPRVTQLGRFLRKFRLDEFPQCINVLRGEMSFVGPRPFNLRVAAEMDELPGSSLRYAVRPGITGFALIKRTGAVSGSNKEAVLRRIRDADLTYVQFANFWLDLRILAAAPLVMLSGRGRA